jgi:tRNA-Thr(GGU) m(6)t(6)A37 methyltransferase TsaA
MAYFTPEPIGFAHTPYQDAAKMPKGMGAQYDAEGVLRILPKFAEGLADIDGFSHLYVLWVFDRTDGYDLTTTPPKEEKAHGLFATRAPRRPNPIALTLVELIRREGNDLYVNGVDMLDGSPILDLKPCIKGISPERLSLGWLEEGKAVR